MAPIESILLDIEYCINKERFIDFGPHELISDHYGRYIELMSTLSFYMYLEKYKTSHLFRGCCCNLNCRDGIFLIGTEQDSRKYKYIVEGYNRRFDEVMKRIPFMFTDKK
jgi:hypothetical protein